MRIAAMACARHNYIVRYHDHHHRKQTSSGFPKRKTEANISQVTFARLVTGSFG